MKEIAKSAQGNILYDDGSIAMSQTDDPQEFKQTQRDLIQMYIHSALSQNKDSVSDVSKYLRRIAPDFVDIAIDYDLDGEPSYSAIWKD